VTVIVTLLVPAAAGLPEIWPDPASMVSPAGKPLADQAYGAVPPLAFTAPLYAKPMTPLGRDEVVIARAAPIVKESVLDTLRCVGVVASVTVTVTLLVPAVVGLPEIWPDEAFIVSPAGNPLADQAYGVVPPAAVTEAL
jgi:hypothetical protein